MGYRDSGDQIDVILQDFLRLHFLDGRETVIIYLYKHQGTGSSRDSIRVKLVLSMGNESH